MKLKKPFLSAVALTAILPITTLANAAVSADSAPVLMGYWTDWSPYDSAKPHPLPVSGSLNNNGQVIDDPAFDQMAGNLNVLNYAFLEADSNGVLQFADPWGDLSAADANFCQANKEICQNQIPNSGLGNFIAFSQLNTKYPNLKRLISVGGAGHDATFHNAFANPDNFVNSVSAIVNSYKLDGIDLDFEPGDGWTADNVQNFTNLAKKLRAALPNSTITMATTANPTMVQQFDGQAHNWQALAKTINYIGIMAYDLHGGFDGVGSPAAFHSNLYSDAKEPYTVHYSGDAAVQTYLQAGVAPQQLVLGVPAYGRVLGSVEDGGSHGLYQPFGSTVSNGDLGNEMQSYASIISDWLGKGFTDYWYSLDKNLSGIYAYNSGTKQFVSYDNAALIDAKAKYVNNNHLAGLMIWELRADISPADPSGASLIKHMHDGLLTAKK